MILLVIILVVIRKVIKMVSNSGKNLLPLTIVIFIMTVVQARNLGGYIY